MAASRTAPATRSILITNGDGSLTQVSDIPSNAKITLGPLQPGSKGDFSSRSDIALRIYTTLGNQLAVFRGVASFRDLSLAVKVQQVKRSATAESQSGPKGRKTSTAEVVDFEWVEAPSF